MEKKYTFKDYLKKQESKVPSFRTKYKHEIQLANLQVIGGYMRQREALRSLLQQYGDNREILIVKYAEMEGKGIVVRKRNKLRLSAVEYAK